ncbi:MAG: right-handed parallel beta-helix repeat-containing protein [Bacteroidales bacterium]
MNKIKINLLSCTGLVILTLFILLSSCRKEDDFITDASAKLSFSTDSVLFDTVFTTLGSVTKRLMVYNPNNKSIKITSIYLGSASASMFRINVDGTPALQINDIEIAANDSMFIFVKVTVNPNNQNNPLIVSDDIIFETNGNIQRVSLTAWGQDAYYHVPDSTLHFSDGSTLKYGFAGCKTPWLTNKPHVIYGYCVVDSDSTLVIPAGCKIYLAPKAVLWIYEGGSLKVYGSLHNEVSFQGSRLDMPYRDLPGQWGKIWLSRGSKDNEINYAVIRNGSVGLQVDTVANTNPTLKINNTIIENMSVAGIFAQGSVIKATNTIVTNCGQYGIVLSIGGNYEFLQCTIGNYWNYGLRKSPSLVLNNYYKDANEVIQLRPLENAYFGNCIIYGNIDEELLLDKNTNTTFNFKFDYCLIKTQLNTSNASIFDHCKINMNPLFSNTTINDLKLLAASPAKGNGNPAIGVLVPIDLAGTSRSSTPSIGAYE